MRTPALAAFALGTMFVALPASAQTYGGGYPVCGNFDVTPAKYGQVQTLIELASIENVDVSLRRPERDDFLVHAAIALRSLGTDAWKASIVSWPSSSSVSASRRRSTSR